MMASSVGVPADVLLQCPWLPVSIAGCQLLAKSWFGETTYHVLLTDMHCVWEESMDSAAIQNRAQELNRRLRAPVGAFFSHLCKVAQPCLLGKDRRPDDGAQVSMMRQDDGGISMKMKSELAGLPFYWEFHCSPAPVTVVCVQLVRPLLAMSHLLQRQVDQLGGQLMRKDAEIQDYRENGATLSRERLQTEVFEEQTYREDFLTKALPLMRPDALTFDADLQQLYAAIVARDDARHREPSKEEPPPAEGTEGSSSPGVSAGGGAGEDSEPNTTREDAAGAKMADRPSVQQSLPLPSGRGDGPSSKPKKKRVGLFR